MGSATRYVLFGEIATWYGKISATEEVSENLSAGLGEALKALQARAGCGQGE
jgi:hypothetical protein